MIRFLALTLVLTMLLTVPAAAVEYYTSGGHTFVCYVRNQHFKDIRDVRVTGYVSGTTARLDFRAPGYRDAHETVYITGTSTQHSVNVRMDDPTIFINVRDHQGGHIAGAYYSDSQSMYWADEFGVTFRIPRAGFEKLTEKDVVLRVNSFTPFGARVTLRGGGDWRVDAVFKRRDLQNYSNRVELYVKRDAEETRVTPLAKPENLAGKAQLYARIVEGMTSVPADLAAGMADVLQSEIEALVLNSEDLDESLRIVGTGHPGLDELVHDLLKKSRMRDTMQQK